MWQRMRPLVDGCIVVTLEQTKRAMRMIAERVRVIAEGAGALPLAAALTGEAGPGPIVVVVSGGNVDLKTLLRDPGVRCGSDRRRSALGANALHPGVVERLGGNDGRIKSCGDIDLPLAFAEIALIDG